MADAGENDAKAGEGAPAGGDHGPERRITFVITSLGLGGAQQQVRHLARALSGRGWDVHVLTLLGGEAGGGYDERLPPGVTTSSLGMRRGVPDPRAVWRLVRHVRERRPSVVHSHMIHANLLVRAARPLVRMPVLVTTACNEREGGRWADVAYRLTDRFTDLTTNKSPRAVRRFVEGGAAPSDRIRFVPNGIDVSAYASADGDEIRRRVRQEVGVDVNRFLWLAAGRLEPAKDLPNLIRALAEVVGTDPANHVLLAGDGPERERLERTARDEGVSEHVSFLGYRDDVASLMAAADAYLMSSAWEGLPMTLLEAGASSMPMVATDVGGNSEVVLDEETGFLVPPGDDAALAAAMLRLAGLPDEARRAMGDRAHDHVKATFDLDRIAGVWEDIYEEVRASR